MIQHYNDIEKGQIIAFKIQGHSAWYFRNKLLKFENKPSIRIINKIYKDHQDKQEQNGAIVNKRGRNPMINEEQKERIRLAVLRNKPLTASSIQRSKILNPNNASCSTIERLLNNMDLVARICPSKPSISNKNISERLIWAEGMQGVSFFAKSKGNNLLESLKDLRYPQSILALPNNFMEDWKSLYGGLLIMMEVWQLYTLKINQTRIPIYKSQKIFNLIDNGQLNNKLFQQDNQAVHISKKVSNYLKDEGVDILDWPPQSPDMSPIENVWAWIKNQLEKQKGKIKSKEDLWRYTQKEFFSEGCSNLIRNMYSNYQNRKKKTFKVKRKVNNNSH